jgi:hypothetical protein
MGKSYFYFEEELGRRSAAKLLTRDHPGNLRLSTSERKRLRANVRTCGHSCKCHKRLRLPLLHHSRPADVLAD